MCGGGRAGQVSLDSPDSVHSVFAYTKQSQGPLSKCTGVALPVIQTVNVRATHAGILCSSVYICTVRIKFYYMLLYAYFMVSERSVLLKAIKAQLEAPALTRPAVPLLNICSLGLHVNGHLFMSSRLLFGGEHLKLLWDKQVPQSTTQTVLAHRHTANLQLLITINALHGFSTPSEITVIPELLCNYLSFRLISVLLTLLSLVTLPPHFYL